MLELCDSFTLAKGKIEIKKSFLFTVPKWHFLIVIAQYIYLYFTFYFILEFSWFTMLCEFPVFSKGIHTQT